MINKSLIQARGLQADILGASTIWIPRREILLEWLKSFLVRAAVPTYQLGESEAEDLDAIDQLLRKKRVPVAT